MSIYDFARKDACGAEIPLSDCERFVPMVIPDKIEERIKELL